MFLFLINNFVLTLIAIWYNRYSRANVSAKLTVSAFAAICWIIPFTLLRDLIPQEATVNVTWLAAQFPSDTISAVTSKVISPINSAEFNFSFSLNRLFLLASGIGLLLMVFRISKQIKWFNSINSQLNSTAIKTHFGLPVYSSSQIKNAVLIGYNQPKIVVNPRLIQSNYSDIILEHEATHFRHFDNYWLTILQMFRAFYWWNPLIKYLLNNIEELLEHRCDYKTSQSFTEGTYLKKLTDLILDDFNANLPPVANTGFASAVISKNPNIKRLKTLQENQTMNIFSKTSAALLLISSVIFVSIPFSSADNINVHYPNSPIFSSVKDDQFSLEFQAIPIQNAARIFSEFTGINYEIEEDLKASIISIKAHRITPINSLAIFSHLSNTHWQVENDKLSISALPGEVKNASEQSDGKELSVSLVFLNRETGKESKDLWAYDLNAERLVDFYLKDYLVKAKATLLNEDEVEMQFELYTLVGNTYQLEFTPRLITKLGEKGFIGIDGEKLLTIVAERL